MKKPQLRPEIADCIILFCINLLSALPYVFRLSFSSIDWLYQATLIQFSHQGIGAMFRSLVAADRDLSVRPGQLAYLVLGFKVFGRHATLYHVAGSLMLPLATIVLYLVLVELPVGRWLAFVMAALFGLLPHYSTDRFWISSQQATVSLLLALLGIYALMRAVRPEGKHAKIWLGLAAAAFVLCFLFYEVAFGLVLAAFVFLGVRRYRRARRASKEPLAALAGFAIPLGALLLVIVLKARGQHRLHMEGRFYEHLGMWAGKASIAISQAVRFNLWIYGLKMPADLAVLYRQAAIGFVAISTAGIISVVVAGYLWRNVGPSGIPDRRTSLLLIFTGFVLFALGYCFFFYTGTVNFCSPGDDNRVAIASALGVPCILVGIAGFAFSFLRSHVLRSRAFAVAVGLLCGTNCLVVLGIGSFWVKAAREREAILRTVAANVPPLPHGSVLLLDGVCRVDGPAVVFQWDPDVTGAIRILMRDSSLQGDLVSPNLQLAADRVNTVYGDGSWIEASYPYGPHLYVFNVKQRSLATWPSRKAAAAYLRTHDPTRDGGCSQEKPML